MSLKLFGVPGKTILQVGIWVTCKKWGNCKSIVEGIWGSCRLTDNALEKELAKIVTDIDSDNSCSVIDGLSDYDN